MYKKGEKMNRTNISWTEYSWNPIRGCSKISEGCRYCYAEDIALRFHLTPERWSKKFANMNIQFIHKELDEPAKIKKPSYIFTCSMSDVFHEFVPFDYIDKIFQVMAESDHHTFQILTKRPKRAIEYKEGWLENIWLGTSVENQKELHRIDSLRETNAQLKFLSIEPLLEPLGDNIDLTDIDWVIVGGESGQNFRPMKHSWARQIRDQCVEKQIPFFFKQSAGRYSNYKPELEEINDIPKKWEQMPKRLNYIEPPPKPQEPQQLLFC